MIYPYPKAVSVSAEDQGMEYPMICWNTADQMKKEISDRIKYECWELLSMKWDIISFPMIVNWDERQWSWMDEGLNTFLEYLTETSFDPNFPNNKQEVQAKNIVPYMKGNQKF